MSLNENPVGHGQNHFVAVIHQHLDGINNACLRPTERHALFATVVGSKVRVWRRNNGIAAVLSVPPTAVYFEKLF